MDEAITGTTMYQQYAANVFVTTKDTLEWTIKQLIKFTASVGSPDRIKDLEEMWSHITSMPQDIPILVVYDLSVDEAKEMSINNKCSVFSADDADTFNMLNASVEKAFELLSSDENR